MSIFKRNLMFLIPSLSGGGAERTLINLIHKIDFKQYNVDLVIVCKIGEYLSQIPPEVNQIFLFKSNFLVRVLSYLQKKIGFSYLFKKRIQLKVKKKYDVSISFLDSNFTDLLFFLKDESKKYTFVHSAYVTNNNFAKFYKKVSYREKLIKERYQKLNGICFVSQDAMDEFIKTFGLFPNMEVIYNIIDSKNVIKKSELKKIEKTNNFQFIALGSLLPVKGFDRLIRSAKIVSENGFDFNIIIAGKGPEEQKLKKLIIEKKLENYIKIIGFQSNPYPNLLNADVFVMSSISEALPTVLCEAMILGKPVLATNCSGCREIIDNENFGLLANQNDKDLADKMIAYISNPKLLDFYSQKSLERAKIFDEIEILKKYHKIFDN